MSTGSRPLHGFTVFELAELIAAREATSEELVQSCLDRIAERDGQVKAWRYLDPELALEQARARDAEEPRGPLHGVPVGVKDIIDTADMPTEYGTEIHRGHRPDADADCVERLRAAGAVILGKTVTTEFATKDPAETTNPYDATRTPGGSSSGSAAAVGDDMVPLALGTQTVGSTIRPALFCGVYAIKPTWNLVDMTGVNQTSFRLDTIGLFARAPRDLGLLLGTLAREWEPPPAEDGAPRIAVVRTPWWDAADEDSVAAFERAVELVTEAGAELEQLELPAEFDGILDVHDTITVADLARCMAHEYEANAHRLSEIIRVDIERGQRVTEADYEAASEATDGAREALGRIFESYDALLAPAVTGEAPEGLGWTGDPIFCRAWSLLGPPCVAVPVSRGSHDLPLGVQLVGPHRGDAALLRLAERLHRVAGS